MKVAFVTEMHFTGKIEANHPNMRTEFAWMHALNATHHNIHDPQINGYDAVIVIFPKGEVYLNAAGSKIVQKQNPITEILSSDIVSILRKSNHKVYYMQEGPHWWFNDYELHDQINFYNLLTSCDGVFAHNKEDAKYYRGLLPNQVVHVMPTLMIEDSITNIKPHAEEKVIVGGNFARWYGGFESYMIAQEFNVPIWGQISHAMRDGENQLIQHLPRVLWSEWMKQLSSFKYAVHLMPTVAAGTFSLNCAYFGIPCIGNIKVDTQNICHPELSVDINDIEKARMLAQRLNTDRRFYQECSLQARANYETHYSVEKWKLEISNILKK